MDNNDDSVPNWARKPLLGFSTWSTQLLDNVPGYGGKNQSPWFNHDAIVAISNMMRKNLPRYEYINMDSGWSNTVDEYGRWMYRSDLFPFGLAALSQILACNQHKLGIYLLPGIPAQAADQNLRIHGTQHRLGDYTRQKKPGNVFRDLTYMPDVHDEVMQHYFDTMADLFYSWGIGYIKMDGCGPGSGDQITPHLAPDCRQTIRLMSRAFKKRNIWVELSWYLDPGYADEWAVMANGARVFIDIESYSSRTMTSTSRVMDRFRSVEPWLDHRQVIGSHSGFYLDLDAVLVGMTTPWNGRCIDGLDSDDVRRSYITFWAMVSSVFCIGADPRLLPPKYIAMLHHPILIDMHQSGILPVPLAFTDPWHYRQVWWKKIDRGICVAMFNTWYYPLTTATDEMEMQNNTKWGWLDLEVGFELQQLGLTGARLLNVWTGADLGARIGGAYTTRLGPGECQLLLLTSLDI